MLRHKHEKYKKYEAQVSLFYAIYGPTFNISECTPQYGTCTVEHPSKHSEAVISIKRR